MNSPETKPTAIRCPNRFVVWKWLPLLCLFIVFFNILSVPPPPPNLLWGGPTIPDLASNKACATGGFGGQCMWSSGACTDIRKFQFRGLFGQLSGRAPRGPVDTDFTRKVQAGASQAALNFRLENFSLVWALVSELGF